MGLGHGFHAAKQGVRFTLSEPARRLALILGGYQLLPVL